MKGGGQGLPVFHLLLPKVEGIGVLALLCTLEAKSGERERKGGVLRRREARPFGSSVSPRVHPEVAPA